MIHIVYNWITCLFPERSSHIIVKRLTSSTPITLWQHHHLWLSLASYREPAVRALIHEAKYHDNEHAHDVLGHLLSEYLQTVHLPCVIVPIPLHRKRKKKRGYNQLLRILNKSHLTHHHLAHHWLIRIRDTQPQTRLSHQERQHNLDDAFAVPVATQQALKGAHIILLDDVVTTGATFEAAKAALSPHSPASITCVALAH